jgi:hypothetical protein
MNSFFKSGLRANTACKESFDSKLILFGDSIIQTLIACPLIVVNNSF